MSTFEELSEELQQHLHVEQIGMQQYKLLLPSDLFKRVQKEAKKRGMSMAELIRILITIGLALIAELEPGAQLIVQKEGKLSRQIIIPL